MIRRFAVCAMIQAIVSFFYASPLIAQPDSLTTRWYESVRIRGYMQVRYNRLLETNPLLQCEQCDQSWGGDDGFFIRRMRIILYGQISRQVSFYIQPDFANSVNDGLHYGRLRDAYVDVGLDPDNEFRFRVGQSKIPFGFENLQSSQNRLPLDRNDGLNSALSNERDLGVMFYWAPQEKRELLSGLVRDGLKGSGDYGIIGIGVFNGQTANEPDLNNTVHTVVRFSYPFQSGNQIIEASIQGYAGKFVIPESQISEGVLFEEDREYTDRRVAGSFVLYPKPLGIQAEYNIGEGPEFNPASGAIELQKLHGGYAMISYRKELKNQVIIPFTRIQYYDGGKKHEQDARRYLVKEMEFGVEWQPVRQLELVAMYTISSRRFEDYLQPDNLQEGQLLRLQLQVNF